VSIVVKEAVYAKHPSLSTVHVFGNTTDVKDVQLLKQSFGIEIIVDPVKSTLVNAVFLNSDCESAVTLDKSIDVKLVQSLNN